MYSEIKSRLVMTEAAFKNKSFHQQVELKYKEETGEVLLHLEHSSYGAETWTLRKVDQEYLESFEMWCWRGMDKISLTDLVKNEEVLHTAKGERGILLTMKRTKANWFGHILYEKCLPKHFIKGKIEGPGRRGRSKKLLNDLGSEKVLENDKRNH
jgi:hypothetical protein